MSQVLSAHAARSGEEEARALPPARRLAFLSDVKTGSPAEVTAADRIGAATHPSH